MHNFITAAELSARMDEQSLIILDGSWHLPDQDRDAHQEYLDRHIPGAQFFDIDAVSDKSVDLPHMLPNEEEFAHAASELGIWNDSPIVVYDSLGLFSAARVWWNFRVMGHSDVRILEGGLPAWEAAGLKTSSGPPAENGIGSYTAHIQRQRVADRDAVLNVIENGGAAILDARPEARFNGGETEPRPGLRSGHMPGAKNVFFKRLLTDDGKLKSKDELREAFIAAGHIPGESAITSCGSGVTAAILTLALAELGEEDIRLYDGSWAEWGADPTLPIATIES
ncbi:MAG: 3-mercaptopyruvate sulfurtransferase [Pseudomonadota bacterium]